MMVVELVFQQIWSDALSPKSTDQIVCQKCLVFTHKECVQYDTGVNIGHQVYRVQQAARGQGILVSLEAMSSLLQLLVLDKVQGKIF